MIHIIVLLILGLTATALVISAIELEKYEIPKRCILRILAYFIVIVCCLMYLLRH